MKTAYLDSPEFQNHPRVIVTTTAQDLSCKLKKEDTKHVDFDLLLAKAAAKL